MLKKPKFPYLVITYLGRKLIDRCAFISNFKKERRKKENIIVTKQKSVVSWGHLFSAMSHLKGHLEENTNGALTIGGATL